MDQIIHSRAIDLVIEGNDISQYLAPGLHLEESRAEWTVHVELVRNQHTPSFLRPLNDRKVSVEYRRVAEGSIGPWRSGYAEVSWRMTEAGTEELILHGEGRLTTAQSKTKNSGGTITAQVTKQIMVAGRVTQMEELGEATIAFVEEDPQEKALREEQIRIDQEAEIIALTSPSFILLLAQSAHESYRVLSDSGISQGNGRLVYSSFIFLPLAIEYYMKYLLHESKGTFKGEYHTHKLLKLFDFLPHNLQESIGRRFMDELESIGRDHVSQNLRVFLKKSQNAFTVIRYLFDPKYAKASRHLIEPENIAVMQCVLNALKHVTDEISGKATTAEAT